MLSIWWHCLIECLNIIKKPVSGKSLIEVAHQILKFWGSLFHRLSRLKDRRAIYKIIEVLHQDILDEIFGSVDECDLGKVIPHLISEVLTLLSNKYLNLCSSRSQFSLISEFIKKKQLLIDSQLTSLNVEGKLIQINESLLNFFQKNH